MEVYLKKPFPSRVRWRKVWKYRYVLLNFVNQVAHGSLEDAHHVTTFYGGDDTVGAELFFVAKKCIEVKK